MRHARLSDDLLLGVEGPAGRSLLEARVGEQVGRLAGGHRGEGQGEEESNEAEHVRDLLLADQAWVRTRTP